jgi:hypothetical protein
VSAQCTCNNLAVLLDTTAHVRHQPTNMYVEVLVEGYAMWVESSHQGSTSPNSAPLARLCCTGHQATLGTELFVEVWPLGIASSLQRSSLGVDPARGRCAHASLGTAVELFTALWSWDRSTVGFSIYTAVGTSVCMPCGLVRTGMASAPGQYMVHVLFQLKGARSMKAGASNEDLAVCPLCAV